jgi:hypothetical protein
MKIDSGRDYAGETYIKEMEPEPDPALAGKANPGGVCKIDRRSQKYRMAMGSGLHKTCYGLRQETVGVGGAGGISFRLEARRVHNLGW